MEIFFDEESMLLMIKYISDEIFGNEMGIQKPYLLLWIPFLKHLRSGAV